VTFPESPSRPCAREPVLGLPGVLGVGMRGPEVLGDVVGVEVRARFDGADDRLKVAAWMQCELGRSDTVPQIVEIVLNERLLKE
jgi:hypothetical protein